MGVIDKIKTQKPERRRAITIAVLVVLALPLLWVVLNNFQARANILRQSQEAGLNTMALPEPAVDQVVPVLDEIQQGKEQLDQFYSDMAAALESASSSPTTTPTTTNENNLEK